MTKPGGWEDKAACKGHPNPSVFFPPEKGPQDYTEAKKVCDSCPVSKECLEFALANFEPFGMFGGLTPVERWKLQEVAS